MTRLVADVRSDVVAIMGDTGQVLLSDARVLPWINQAQLEIARKTDCLETNQAFSSIVGTPNYALPTTFLKTQRVTLDNYPLTQTSVYEVDSFDPGHNNNAPGFPAFFYIHGGNLYLEPAPSVVGTNNIKIFFIKIPTVLSAVSGNLELPDYLYDDVVRYVLMRAQEYMTDTEAAANTKRDVDLRLIEARFDSNNERADSYYSVRDHDAEWWG